MSSGGVVMDWLGFDTSCAAIIVGITDTTEALLGTEYVGTPNDFMISEPGVFCENDDVCNNIEA